MGYKHSIASKARLKTVNRELQLLFNTVLKEFDNSIIYGVRGKETQNYLFRKGREFDGEKWIIVNKSEVVTYCQWPDSDHNVLNEGDLAIAVDAAPYINGRMVIPTTPLDIKQIYFFAGYVKGVADRLYKEGQMKHRLGWGGDWDNDKNVNDQNFNDLFHYYLIVE